MAETVRRALLEGDGVTITTTATATCPACSTNVEAGDRFCAGCGGPIAPPQPTPAPPAEVSAPTSSVGVAPAPAGPELAALLSAHPERIPGAALLSESHPFCRSCGADHATDADTCATCGSRVAPLPPRLDGPLGRVFSFRRKMIKRRAVQIGTEGTAAKVLFESGEESLVEMAELPEPNPSPIAEGERRPLRTANGQLLHLSLAIRAGEVKSKWDPDALSVAALAGVDTRTTARLVAMDAMELGWIGVVDSLPLSDAERLWLRAVHATRTGDAAAGIAAIAALPPNGYRGKLGLLARLVPAARAAGADVSALEAQLSPYLATEPLAALLHRALGFSRVNGTPGGDVASDTVRSTSRLSACPGIPDELRSDLVAGFSVLANGTADVPAAVRYLPRNTRVLLARAHPRQGLVGPADIGALPRTLVDDMIDSRAVDRAVVLGGAADEERALYLRARVAPETLNDADVARLEHMDERIRRAFRHNDAEAFADIPDSPAVRHFRALLALRGKRPDPALLDDVRPEARPVVERLLKLVGAKAEKADLSQFLDDVLVKDPTVWPVLAEIAGSTGLTPTRDLQERFPAFTEWLSLNQAREFLFRGDWGAAVRAADQCLALAKDEAVRDEALNLKACGLHHLGNDTSAIAALEEAIEGAHSENLLANIGVVAAGLQPETAGRYLGMLMREAPTIAMRVAAARRAVAIWSTSDTESWRNSDASPLPDAFQDPLHELVVGPISLDDFRDFASLLAVQDSDWFGVESNIASSPHRNTLEAKFYVARSSDLHEMVAIMGKAMAGGNAPQWVIDERDSLRSAAVDILFENVDEPDNTFGAVALSMVDHNVLADENDRLLFTGLGIASVTYHLSMRQTEVADKIVQRMLDLRSRWQRVDGEDRERLEPIVELATRRVAINRMEARDRDLQQAIDVYNSAIDLGNRAEYGSPAYFEAMRRVRAALEVATLARDDLRPLMPLVDHAAVRDGMNETIETTRELEGRCLRVLN